MKVEITEVTRKKRFVKIRFPYFFKWLGVLEIIYGKVLEDSAILIKKPNYNIDSEFFKAEIIGIAEINSLDSQFFKPGYKSTKEEFEKAINEITEFIKRESK
jgi:hypothetical protein